MLLFNIRPDSRSSQDFLFFSPLCAKSASTSPRNPLYGSAISLEIKGGGRPRNYAGSTENNIRVWGTIGDERDTRRHLSPL